MDTATVLMKLKRTNHFLSGLLSKSEMAIYQRLIKNIGQIIYNDETFKLFVLVLLFSDINECNSESLTCLRNSYLNVIRRRLDHLHIDDYSDDYSSVNYDNLAIGAMVYSKFNSCIVDIKELSTFMEKLLAKLNQIKKMN